MNPLFYVITIAVFAGLMIFVYGVMTPQRAAKNVKMMGLSGAAQRQTYVGMKLALEDAKFRKMLVESLLNDPEIRAMLYDAFQAEYQKRKR